MFSLSVILETVFDILSVSNSGADKNSSQQSIVIILRELDNSLAMYCAIIASIGTDVIRFR